MKQKHLNKSPRSTGWMFMNDIWSVADHFEKFHLEPPRPPRKNDCDGGKWVRLPYLGGPSEKLAAQLRKYDYNIGFYSVTTVGRPLAPKNKSGVYQVECGICSSFYTNQTGRKLRVRLGEHRTAFSVWNWKVWPGNLISDSSKWFKLCIQALLRNYFSS